MKRLVIVPVILVLVVLAVPVSNLMVGLPTSKALAGADIPDALSRKCVNCHTGEYVLPFYAKLPPAKGVIEKDILDGTAYLDMGKALVPSEGKPVSEVVLAKVEYALKQGTMPPARYLALHWNGGLSSEEKAGALDWIVRTRAKHYATEGASGQNVLQPLPEPTGLDARKVALGDKLFHDKRLSADDTVACATCHALDKGGTDQLQFSEGINKAVGGINAPTVYNSGFQFIQFWDGRAADLEEQADGPVNNPIEMGSNWAQAIPKLEQDAAFTQEFLAAYPQGYSKETITSAIATFERTLVTTNSKFDRFLKGQVNALDAQEKAGYALFLDKGCAMCHVGKIIGGQSFELMGRKADYFGDRGGENEADYGRFNFTKDQADKFRLKVPTLRDVAVTHPYFHDGSTSDLAEAVQTMAKYQVGQSLSATETEQITKFLRTLTGEYKGQLLQ